MASKQYKAFVERGYTNLKDHITKICERDAKSLAKETTLGGINFTFLFASAASLFNAENLKQTPLCVSLDGDSSSLYVQRVSGYFAVNNQGDIVRAPRISFVEQGGPCLSMSSDFNASRTAILIPGGVELPKPFYDPTPEIPKYNDDILKDQGEYLTVKCAPRDSSRQIMRQIFK